MVNDLHLDPLNVRLETTSTQIEADIIEDLFDNEGAFDLVEAISQIGYLTHEIPIVVKQRGKYIVVEGNRRLAALKAIQNPMIVPGYQSRVTVLAKSMGTQRDRLKQIEVLVAPNRQQANQVIAALHTSNPRKSWTPARQAAFFQAQIDAGRKYKDLLTRYPTIDVPKFVLRARLVNRMKAAVKSDADLSDFTESKGFKSGYSTLTRIFEAKDFRDVTGIDLDANGNLDTVLTDDQFDATSELIVRGMQDGTINTRTINTVGSPRFTQLMSEIRTAIGMPTATPPAPGGGSGGPSPGAPAPGGGKGGTGKGGKTAKKSPPPKKTKQTVLNTGHIVAPAAYPVAVRLHLEELSILNIQRTPNATFVLLRATLEKSIKAYAEAKGVDISTTRHQTHGRVQLHNCLNWLVEHLQKNGPKVLVDPAKKLQGGRLAEFTGTKAALNAVNHNQNYHADADDVVTAWNSMDAVMRELMKP
ncbi:hypothetical protein [Nocardioides sp.]|uniref:hypothetical protein n=1 Tax=Nocardioides sp. TaxID=35761 RepID=UPI0037847602